MRNSNTNLRNPSDKTFIEFRHAPVNKQGCSKSTFFEEAYFAEKILQHVKEKCSVVIKYHFSGSHLAECSINAHLISILPLGEYVTQCLFFFRKESSSGEEKMVVSGNNLSRPIKHPKQGVVVIQHLLILKLYWKMSLLEIFLARLPMVTNKEMS